MNDNFKFSSLLSLVFVFAVLLQSCSFNFSVGDKITDAEAETLATKTLQNFNRSLQRGDFEQFHQTEIAPSLKNELTTEKINLAFAQFIADRTDIRPKEGTHINWTVKPQIDGKFLNLKGNYPAQSGQTVNFTLQYIKDPTDWNLKYIDININ